jgi:hypothetical protein
MLNIFILTSKYKNYRKICSYIYNLLLVGSSSFFVGWALPTINCLIAEFGGQCPPYAKEFMQRWSWPVQRPGDSHAVFFFQP